MYTQAACGASRAKTPSDLRALPFLVLKLTNAEKTEVLAFLARRPLHTVAMTGLILDNGLESPLNRGAFYACRDAGGAIEGVALIGHATLMEARTERAVEGFAALARESAHVHMIMGEQERVREFWTYYAAGGQQMRLACRELLFELRWPTAVQDEVRGLRPATLDDLELIVPAQAEMAFAESGVNPLDKDSEGFRSRCARRIEKGRTWVLIEDGRLIFKAEIQSETPDCIYLEGVYVNASERGRGIGTRCLSQLNLTLLARTKSLCLLVNEHNREAHALYQKLGYVRRGLYDSIFLQQKS